MDAAVSKLTRNQDLSLTPSKGEVITRFRSSFGRRDTLTVRLQPNHPTDNPHGITTFTFNGLLKLYASKT